MLCFYWEFRATDCTVCLQMFCRYGIHFDDTTGACGFDGLLHVDVYRFVVSRPSAVR